MEFVELLYKSNIIEVILHTSEPCYSPQYSTLSHVILPIYLSTANFLRITKYIYQTSLDCYTNLFVLTSCANNMHKRKKSHYTVFLSELHMRCGFRLWTQVFI